MFAEGSAIEMGSGPTVDRQIRPVVDLLPGAVRPPHFGKRSRALGGLRLAACGGLSSRSRNSPSSDWSADI
jgi:hypothetical protein